VLKGQQRGQVVVDQGVLQHPQQGHGSHAVTGGAATVGWEEVDSSAKLQSGQPTVAAVRLTVRSAVAKLELPAGDLLPTAAVVRSTVAVVQ
jgi:hypothetical protein